MKPLINKVTFKSWCHPLLAVSALCLLSGAPDPPLKCCVICTQSHSLTLHGTHALPKCVSVMPADWWPCVVPKSCLARSWRPTSPLDLRIACAQRTNSLPELGSKVLHPCLLCVLSRTQLAGGAALIPKGTHDRGAGHLPGRVCWQIWVPDGEGFCF